MSESLERDIDIVVERRSMRRERWAAFHAAAVFDSPEYDERGADYRSDDNEHEQQLDYLDFDVSVGTDGHERFIFMSVVIERSGYIECLFDCRALIRVEPL